MTRDVMRERDRSASNDVATDARTASRDRWNARDAIDLERVEGFATDGRSTPQTRR